MRQSVNDQSTFDLGAPLAHGLARLQWQRVPQASIHLLACTQAAMTAATLQQQQLLAADITRRCNASRAMPAPERTEQ